MKNKNKQRQSQKGKTMGSYVTVRLHRFSILRLIGIDRPEIVVNYFKSDK